MSVSCAKFRLIGETKKNCRPKITGSKATEGLKGGGGGERRHYAGNVREVEVRWLLMALPDLHDLWRITSSTVHNPVDSFFEPLSLQLNTVGSQMVQPPLAINSLVEGLKLQESTTGWVGGLGGLLSGNFSFLQQDWNSQASALLCECHFICEILQIYLFVLQIIALANLSIPGIHS